MKLEVGMFVRTELGIIDKIKEINETSEDDEVCLENNNEIGGRYYYGNDTITKSSNDIIDLIEVGDYVNGSKVEQISYGAYKENEDGMLKGVGEKLVFFGFHDYVDKNNIKQVLTKEQYEANVYRIGSDE